MKKVTTLIMMAVTVAVAAVLLVGFASPAFASVHYYRTDDTVYGIGTELHTPSSALSTGSATRKALIGLSTDDNYTTPHVEVGWVYYPGILNNKPKLYVDYYNSYGSHIYQESNSLDWGSAICVSLWPGPYRTTDPVHIDVNGSTIAYAYGIFDTGTARGFFGVRTSNTTDAMWAQFYNSEDNPEGWSWTNWIGQYSDIGTDMDTSTLHLRDDEVQNRDFKVYR
jgi:hypothetical protein